jgi:exodeoxyribonuclease VIII
MMDLETLGTVPGCVGFAIGAVEFLPNENKLGREFYTLVSVSNSLDNLLTECPDTRAWWRKQSDEAKTALHAAEAEDAPQLSDALHALNGFLLGLGGLRSVRLYGNGADFDNPILRVMYDAASVPFMGSKAGFFGGRCYRTLKNLDELLGPRYAAPKLARQGTYHNALDDAKSQAQHLMDTLAAIRGVGN